MTFFRDLIKELVGMFLTDVRLATATMVLVAFVAILILLLRIEPIVGGALLLLGCLIIVVEAAVREAGLRGKS